MSHFYEGLRKLQRGFDFLSKHVVISYYVYFPLLNYFEICVLVYQSTKNDWHCELVYRSCRFLKENQIEFHSVTRWGTSILGVVLEF